MNQRDFEPFIGIPFVDGGRDMSGCDCWGLVCLVYEQMLDIKLDPYAGYSAMEQDKNSEAMRKDIKAGVWTLVDAPRTFDLVQMRGFERVDGRICSYPSHIGLWIDQGPKILQARQNSTGVELSDPNSPLLKDRLIRFGRHKDLI